MKNYYFTFGCGQVLARYYVLIPAKSYLAARQIMFDHFGARWAFQYDEKLWNEGGCSLSEKYGLEKLDLKSELAKLAAKIEERKD